MLEFWRTYFSCKDTKHRKQLLLYIMNFSFHQSYQFCEAKATLWLQKIKLHFRPISCNRSLKITIVGFMASFQVRRQEHPVTIELSDSTAISRQQQCHWNPPRPPFLTHSHYVRQVFVLQTHFSVKNCVMARVYPRDVISCT